MTSRNTLLDLLKLWAIIMVIMIHLPGTENVRQCLFPFNPNAVFAMIAGMYTFSGQSMAEWFGKRMRRILLPYAVWEVIYIVLGLLFDIVKGKSVVVGAPQVLNWVFFGGASVHLWFIITLFYVQLVLFVVQRLVRGRMPLICELFLFGALSALGIAIWLEFDYGNLRNLFFMLGYCSLGAIVGSPIIRRIPDAALVTLSAFAVAVAVASGFGVGVVDVVGLVLLVKWLGEKVKVDFPLCKYAMGVYLCHFVFTRLAAFAYPKLSSLLPQLSVVLIETLMVFTISCCLVRMTAPRVGWMWGMGWNKRSGR